MIAHCLRLNADRVSDASTEGPVFLEKLNVPRGFDVSVQGLTERYPRKLCNALITVWMQAHSHTLEKQCRHVPNFRDGILRLDDFIGLRAFLGPLARRSARDRSRTSIRDFAV